MRLFAVVMLTGCSLDLSFESEATTIHANAGETGTRVTICAGPQGLLSCNTDEEFQVFLGNEFREATLPFLSFGTKEAFFDTNAAGSEIRVIRTRDGAFATATLPEPFTLAGPAPTDVLTRDDSFELTWEPDGRDKMIMDFTLDCDGALYFHDDIEIDDDGSQVVAIDGFPEGEPGLCRASVELRRTRRGSIDSKYADDSSIDGRQVRSIEFDLVQ